MKRPQFNIGLLLASVGGIAYPFVVYSCTVFAPSWLFLAMGLGVIGLRLYSIRKTVNLKLWRGVFGLGALVLVLAFLKNAQVTILFYPVIVSLSVAAIFGFSLLSPPTVVERIARISEPNLPPSGIIYTRRVTWVWFVYLLINACISFSTIRWGTLAQWTFWNGLISYLMMGLLFAGEYLVRKMVRS